MKVIIVPQQVWHGRPKGNIGSSVIRADWLQEEWPESEIWANGKQGDVFILQKIYRRNFIADIPGIKILDLCDPDWMVGDPENGQMLELVDLSKLVDAITCSSDALTEFVKDKIKHIPVMTIPDRLNLKYFTKKKEHRGEARKVVWFGYGHNAKKVLPDALPSLKQHNYDLIVVSNVPFEPSDSCGVKIENLTWTPNDAYMNIQMGDFAINPASMEANYRFKSNNKTLIAWGLGLPVVNFADDLERFKDPLERQKEAEVRWEEIKQKWDIKLSVQSYKDLICNIQKTKNNK